MITAGGLARAFLLAACAPVLAAAQGDAALAPIKPQPAEIKPLAARSTLLDVVLAGGHLVAVGDRGHIVVSSDGERWAQVPSPVRAALTAVYFADDQRGWAVGHDAAILHTADAGRTWALQNFQPELEKPLLDVLFLDRRRGFAVGAHGLYLRTVDGGQNWVESPTPAGNEELHLHSIIRLASDALLVTGDQGLVAYSFDGGLRWYKMRAPQTQALFGAVPHGPRGAIVFGHGGGAFACDDVRIPSWRRLPTGSASALFGAAVRGEDDTVLVGQDGTVLLAGGNGPMRSLRAPAGTALLAAVAMGNTLFAVGSSGAQRIELR